MQYPKVESLFATDDQYMIGSDLLAKPVTSPGSTEVTVSFPAADCWYDARTLERAVPSSSTTSSAEEVATSLAVPTPIDVGIPLYQRGGSVIPRRLRLRRSSALMASDPYTLYVALTDGDGGRNAAGELYMDDETTFDHERRGRYAVARFSANLERGRGGAGYVRNVVELGYGWASGGDPGDDEVGKREVERIVVMGVETPPEGIVLAGSDGGGSSTDLEFEHDAKSRVLVIRKPGVSALRDWEMRLVL